MRQNCKRFEKRKKSSEKRNLNKIAPRQKNSLDKLALHRKKSIFMLNQSNGSLRDILKETGIKDLQVYDGFHVPIKNESSLRLAQTYLTKTDHGYYKYNQMVLTNHELYLFNDR